MFVCRGTGDTATERVSTRHEKDTCTFSSVTSIDQSVSYGDGKEIWSSTAVQGVPIQSASVPVNGILKLEIEFINISGYSYPSIVNPLLSK